VDNDILHFVILLACCTFCRYQ